jgi:hypothetical protein
MKPKTNTFLIILFCTIFYWNGFSQDGSETIIPQISFVSFESHLVDTSTTIVYQSNSSSSQITPPENGISKFLVYELKFSVIVKEKGNVPMRLKIRITSPQNDLHEETLVPDISKLEINNIYNYNIQITAKNSGWFLVELFSDTKENANNVLLDKRNLYFGN